MINLLISLKEQFTGINMFVSHFVLIFSCDIDHRNASTGIMKIVPTSMHWTFFFSCFFIKMFYTCDNNKVFNRTNLNYSYIKYFIL